MSKAKLAIIADTHFGVRNDSEHFAEYQLRWFDWFFEQAEAKGITHIIQLGDLFDRRRYINFSTLSKFTSVFKRFQKYKTFIISGNHDCYYKSTNEVNSVKLILDNYPGITVISELPETHKIGTENFDFFPWISPSNYTETLEYIKKSKSKFGVGHFEFKKFEMHRGQQAEEGMDHTIFKNYTRLYSGHYHTMSAKDNVLYCGTPYELDWSDYMDKKGFWIHSEENPEHLESPEQMYVKIFYDEDNVPEVVDLKGKIVKIFATNKKNQFKFDRFVDEMIQLDPYDLKVVDNTVYATENIDTVENLESFSTIDIISNSVDSLPDTSLDKTKLKNLLTELYIEAVQIMQE